MKYNFILHRNRNGTQLEDWEFSIEPDAGEWIHVTDGGVLKMNTGKIIIYPPGAWHALKGVDAKVDYSPAFRSERTADVK